jgi:hypothetical protein
MGRVRLTQSLRPCVNGEAIMEARTLIDGASYGPDALQAIGRALDDS